MFDRGNPGRIAVSRALFLALVGGMAAACSSTEGPPEKTVADSGTEASVLSGQSDADVDGDAPTCQDDDGSLPSCDSITGLAERQCDRATCDRYVRRMKTRMARLAIACMKQHISAGDSCRPCSADVLKSACPDATAASVCENLTKACPARTVAECTPVFSGLSFGGRLNFITCTTESDCLHDIPSCLP